MKKIIASILALMMVASLFVVGASAEITADTSWYDASKSEFVIENVSQLAGFSKLAEEGNDFVGKTVKLGADVTLNEGDANTWGSAAPELSWTPIKGFAGTFDGQGHTVSGLYAKLTSSSAMFASVSADALIKDFRLVNSYFESEGGGCAGVATGGGGTYERIYCDAIVVCGDHHAGGIFGVCGAPTSVSECWFDGKVTLVMRYAAGIVGNGNNQNVVIEHCLNSGSVYTSYDVGPYSHMGGMCGRNDAGTVIRDCLNVGKLSSAYYEANSSDGVGSVFGACTQKKQNTDGSYISSVTIENSWGTNESFPTALGNVMGDPGTVKDANSIPAKLLLGYSAYYNTTLDFENYWAVDLDGTPVLQYFADEIPEIYDVNMPVIGEAEVKAEGHWGPRWTVSVDIPEGFAPEDVTLGLLAVPTKAVPDGTLLNHATESFEYRGDTYPVADAKGAILRESEEGKLVATFVITDLSEKTVRANFTVRPYATYAVDGGEVTMYGDMTSFTFYTEAKLCEDASTKALLDADLAAIDAAIGEGFTVSRDWSTLDVFEEIPALVADGTAILPAEDKGLGNWVIEIDGTEDELPGYVALLESLGFEKKYENTLYDSVSVVNLTKGDLLVTVTDLSYQNKTFVSSMFDQPLSPHLSDSFRDTAKEGGVNSVTQLEMVGPGNTYVIGLKNGHFIVSDGGTSSEGDILLKYLESLVPEGEKPVVEAWICTHLHNDHFHVLDAYNRNPGWFDRLFVEGFYFSKPSDAVNDIDPGVYGEIANEYRAMAQFKTTEGKTPEIYRVQTGQRYYFCDVTMDILLSQEQIPLSEYEGGFNDSSTWYLFTLDGGTFLNAGDTHRGGMKNIMKSYEPEVLQVDLFQAFHHGHNTWTQYTNWVGEFNVVLFPSELGPWTGTHSQNKNNIEMMRLANETYVAALGTVTFYFPFDIDDPACIVKQPPRAS
ncbi:MAG: hypothetical protein IJV00_02235 [Clostridia bacterium]|nr:hypothetical protein [Clostridia bacterium]